MITKNQCSVLILASHYLPGFKAGGPVRTLVNLVESLGDEFDFHILTTDRDLGDTKPYDTISPGIWTPQGKAQVMYLTPAQQRLMPFLHILKTHHYNLIYLNSFFSAFTRKILFWRRVGALQSCPIVLAPRGEFSPGALSLKSSKKQIYLNLIGRLGLYRKIIWQASSEYEAQDIKSIINQCHLDKHPIISIAPNLPAKYSHEDARIPLHKKPGTVKLIFLSRITPKKNLLLALQCLSDLLGEVQFDIYGPIEDQTYWKACQDIISHLPNNIQVQYLGQVDPDQVKGIFAQYHAFVFPTLGENFGHVILESFSAGCPVIVSDRTRWRNLIHDQAGWDLSLEQPVQFRQVIQDIVHMDQSDWQQWSRGAHKHAKAFISNNDIIDLNRQLFQNAMNNKKHL